MFFYFIFVFKESVYALIAFYFLRQRLWELETARLLKFFRHMLEMDVEEFDVYLVDNGHEQPVSKFTCEEFNNQLMYPLMEVLKYPYLLCHRDLCK